MGVLATCISYHQGTLVCDRGGGDLVYARPYAPPGIDSVPIPGDLVEIEEFGTNGAIVAKGVACDEAIPGAFKIYARDPLTGSVTASITIVGGDLMLDNIYGARLHVQQNGSIDLNGVTIDASGNITTTGNVTAGTVSLKLHAHSGVTTGGGISGAPVGA